MKQVLATTVFAAGTLLTGVALAQPQMQPQMTTEVIPPIAHVADGGHVGNGGYVGPRYTEEVPVAQVAPTVGSMTRQTTWQSPSGGLGTSDVSADQAYTFALNDLSANDFHRIHDLQMQDGRVVGQAETPYHTESNVMVDPASGEITAAS